MNILIFSGGEGTRLWPISRKAAPKQFEVLKGNTSTLQMAIDRVEPWGMEHIFVSTNANYVDLVKKQVPQFLSDHILSEPSKRDLSAAVGLSLMRLKKQGIGGTIAILWADHFMDRVDVFQEALRKADSLVQKNPNQFVFLAEEPRFANHNLGWIHVGKSVEDDAYEFKGWKYRPELLKCQEMFESGDWMWNPGYFVFDIDFVLGLYKKFLPSMYIALEDMVNDEQKLEHEYENLESISFDNGIVEKVEPSQAVVLKVDLGWSDPGTLYALKEALTKKQDENYAKGNVILHETSDSFILNDEKEKLVATVGLEGMIVVNTKDALLVCHKDKVPEIKELLRKMGGEGLEKYL